MKALSIKQPWASLIAHGIKDIENRTWATKYRGTIYIHASSKPSFNNLTLNLTHDQIDQIILGDFVNKNLVGDGYRECRNCGQEWWTDIAYGKPIYNWLLANPVLFDEPILNVKGKLSLWDFDGKEATNG